MPRISQTAFASANPRSPEHALPDTETTLCGQLVFVIIMLTGRQEEALPNSELLCCGASNVAFALMFCRGTSASGVEGKLGRLFKRSQ